MINESDKQESAAPKQPEGDTLERQLQLAKERISKLTRKEAQYRTQRNQALKLHAGLAHVVKHHNIDVSPAVVNLDSLTIKGGVIQGDVVYTPAALAQKKATGQGSAPDGGQGSGLSLLDVKNMTPDEINNRWDEVKNVLAQNK